MESEQFDSVAKRVASQSSRRGILGVSFGALLSVVGASDSSVRHRHHHHHHHHHMRCRKLGHSCTVNKQS